MTILKEHVSYSELRQWKECPWRHKLMYLDKLNTFEESPHLHYGTIIHDACEHFLKTRELKIEEAKDKISVAWEKHGFDSKDFIQLQKQRSQLQGWKYKHSNLETWHSWADTSIQSFSTYLDEVFPGWELVNAESALYESIPDRSTKFKGYIDCILKVPKNSGYKYWILDWKTSSGRGWNQQKQRDFLVQAQVILYKYFWAIKNDVPFKDIQCGFVLLKKVKTVGKSCQLIKVSSGPKSLEKSKKLIKDMLSAVERKMYLKNRNSCMFCNFYNTNECK